jgi:flagellar assembly factor FliW
VLQLREGVLGFAQHKRYLLVENEEILPFNGSSGLTTSTFLSLSSTHISCLVPMSVCALTLKHLHSLEIEHEEDVVGLVVAVIPDDKTRTGR